MVATVTVTGEGLTVKVDTPSITEMTIIADIDMRVGTPIDQTAWLDGGAAAGSYPGALDGFKAKNTNTTNALGGLRMLVLQFNLEDALISVIGLPTGVNSILGCIGSQMSLADKTLSIETGNVGVVGDSTTAPVATGGAMPFITAHAEGAADNCLVTILYQ